MSQEFPGGSQEKKAELVKKFSVERKFSVMHYESGWPPINQRESSVPLEKRCLLLSQLLKKKVINQLREDISLAMFSSLEEVKTFIVDFLKRHVTAEDFGEMAAVVPTLTERIGRGGKFTEIKVQWLDPNQDTEATIRVMPNFSFRHINDPWFAVRVIEKS